MIVQKIIQQNLGVRNDGFTFIEIVLGIGMLTMFILVNSAYYKEATRVSEQTTHHIQSGFLLEEGVESVKLLRDSSWSGNILTLNNDTPYYLHWSGVAWVPTTTPEMIENTFTRTFALSSVERDGSDNIVSSGGVIDSGTKRVTVSVSWRSSNISTSTESVQTYITNLFNN